ncbi:MAG: hypothetical protein KGO92_03930 [Bacteroidota bacterium]|nr:hypothetical protein [Bacteroidota bacterium]
MLSNLQPVETLMLTKEIDMPAKGAIYIENIYGNVIIKTWNQQKVKIATSVSYTGKNTLSSDEWMEKINLSLKKVGNSVKIKSGNVNVGNTYYSTDNSLTITPSQNNVPYLLYRGANGQTITGGINNKTKRDITITLPADSKLDIESKYGDVTLPNNLDELTIDLANGNLDAENMGKLSLRCKYANITVGDIKNAELEITNGQFLANNISDLDLDSKNSSVEMAAVKNVVIRSTNDEVEMEEVGQLSGRKNYGNLRITQLNKSMDLEGVNADVKIRNVGSEVSLIKLNDRYADIRIPLRNVKNYSVDFTGLYSAVYGSFEKKVVNVTADPNASITVTGTLNRNAAAGTGFSSNRNETQPYITYMGTLHNLTVTGSPETTQSVSTVNKNSEVVVTGFPSQGVTSKIEVNNLTITGVKGRLEGGTFVPNTNGLTNITVPGVSAGGNFHGQLSSGTAVAGTIVGATTPMGQVVRGTLSPSTYISSVNANLNDTPSSFVAKVGDGKGLKVDIKCQNCTVDLK